MTRSLPWTTQTVSNDIFTHAEHHAANFLNHTVASHQVPSGFDWSYGVAQLPYVYNGEWSTRLSRLSLAMFTFMSTQNLRTDVGIKSTQKLETKS